MDPLTDVELAAIFSAIDGHTSWGARNIGIIVLLLDGGYFGALQIVNKQPKAGVVPPDRHDRLALSTERPSRHKRR